MTARIYRPARTAMQSGVAKTEGWVLDYTPEQRREADPLMGWTSSRDMQQQIRLAFQSKDEAVAYAQANGLAFRVFDSAPRAPIKKAYADNFRFGRTESWTH